MGEMGSLLILVVGRGKGSLLLSLRPRPSTRGRGEGRKAKTFYPMKKGGNNADVSIATGADVEREGEEDREAGTVLYPSPILLLGNSARNLTTPAAWI
jgi:hypothetical protein